jgi:hypothetical protein
MRMIRAPTSAFWSLTMYDHPSFQVANAIGRFVIGSLDRFRADEDGSTEILIQQEDPGAAMRAHWLPAPNAPFNLTLRLNAVL